MKYTEREKQQQEVMQCKERQTARSDDTLLADPKTASIALHLVEHLPVGWHHAWPEDVVQLLQVLVNTRTLLAAVLTRLPEVQGLDHRSLGWWDLGSIVSSKVPHEIVYCAESYILQLHYDVYYVEW